MKWVRDSGISELIEYFDSDGVAPDFSRPNDTGWARLASRPEELKVIESEIAKCRSDFSRTARNYFWITNKERMDIPFRLFESQELIYEKLRQMKARGRAQKLIIVKSRQLGCCLDPDTKVLTDDLRWIKISTVLPGQALVAVDEHIPGGQGASRKMRTATAVAVREVYEPAFRIRMDNGQVLIATGEHRFLCKRRGGTEAIWASVEGKRRAPTGRSRGPLRPGDQIRYAVGPWPEKHSIEQAYEDGWFGGVLDGEGSLRARDAGGTEACVSQVFNPAYDRMMAYLESRGYAYRVEVDHRKGPDTGKLGDKPVAKLVMTRLNEIFKLIGETRPARFIGKKFWEGKEIPGGGRDRADGKEQFSSWGTVVSVESIGIRRMIDLQTTTGTFIANGFVSHNSTLIEALIAWRTMFFTNVNAIIVSKTPGHAAYLYGIMQHIYKMVPWWLRPMVLSHKIEDGLIFQNPDAEGMRMRPGLNSLIQVQAANQMTGVGEGIRVSAAHLSEVGAWDDDHARSIIEGDLGHALADNKETFAIMETTAKGRGRYFHKLWMKNVDLAEEAEWETLFLPWFFEHGHRRTPPLSWRIDPNSEEFRQRMTVEWVKCDNAECGSMRQGILANISQSGKECVQCSTGTYNPYVLEDEQLYWMHHQRINAAKDRESMKELLQEQCVAGHTRVSSEGIRAISEVNSQYPYPPVHALHRNGKRRTLRITTTMGRVIECTAEHKFGVLACFEWREACNLTPGDRLILYPPEFSYWPYSARWNDMPSVDSVVPVTKTLARFLGYFMGDGCWSQYGPSIACDLQDGDVIEDVSRCVLEITGKEAPLNIVPGTRSGCCNVRSNNKHWFGLLWNLGALKRDLKKETNYTSGYRRKVCVPECIWRSPREIVREFMAALFESDGHVCLSSGRIVFCSNDIQFARDVQLLLLGFGINCKVKTEYKKHKADGHSYVSNLIRLTSECSGIFHEEIGFIGQRKRGRAEESKLRRMHRKQWIPNEMVDTVASIEECGEQEVFDLTVRQDPAVKLPDGTTETHCYSANGFLVHNCGTAEDAFQLSGIQVFPEESLNFVSSTLRPPIVTGYLDRGGVLHGIYAHTGKCHCEGCTMDHEFEDLPLKVWELPKPGYDYVIGVDVAEGLGDTSDDADFSVAFVNKTGKLGEPDEQVAVWRSNNIDPVAFAYPVAMLGRWYNEAMLSIEVNKFDTTFSYVRFQLQYPNLYRWKHVDSTNPNTTKWGWETNMRSKPRMWQTAKHWLRAKMWVIRDHALHHELCHFQKEDYEERGAKSAYGFHDDIAIAAMIALYSAHDMDWDDNLGVIPAKRQGANPDAYPWRMECRACGYKWGANSPEGCFACRQCGSPRIVGERNQLPDFSHTNEKEWDDIIGLGPGVDDKPRFDDYALM